jgi:CubicO group peptidase (beta-lactamase class C family)
MARGLVASCAVICAALTLAASTPAVAFPGVEIPVIVGPPTVSPADIRFAHRTLRAGTPAQVGLLPEYVQRMRADAEAYLAPTPDHPRWPTYAGATVLAAKDGVVVQRFAIGTAVRYSAVGPPPERAGVELPAAEQIPARINTVYDLASVSKLFTTIAVLQLVERERIDLDTPMATYVPEFAAGGKAAVTIRHLLTHTSGLPPFLPLWSAYPTPAERLAAALATPVGATTSPGQQYAYSDIGLIALGVLVERVTGTTLDEAIRTGITGPLNMTDTGFRPSDRTRVAATEYQPYAGRGMVWGEVHDENAWGLGGVAGHAGMFSTVDDLAILCQTLLNGGQYRGRRILSEAMVRTMLVNNNAHLEERYPESDRGLGFELAKHSYMDALASPVTFGHTGFTGTSVVIDPLKHTFLILLSNRVHPDRGWGTNTVARRALARDFADADPVRPAFGGQAWRADRRDGTSVTLTAPLRVPAGSQAHAAFLLWYDTEPRYDTVAVESTVDGTTWTLVPLKLRTIGRRFDSPGSLTGYGGRQWWLVTADLAAGTTHLRWRYATDGTAQGRGVYVDHVLAADSTGVLFDGQRADAGRLAADGWTPTTS